jgi:hypothetical protein
MPNIDGDRMKSEHRYMVAFIAACLKAERLFTHVHDHDAGHEIAVGGVVRPDKVDVIEGAARARIAGEPGALFHFGTQSHIQLAIEEGGFSGFDYASGQHFKGVFSGPLPQAAVQLYDHETGRWHDFHVS